MKIYKAGVKQKILKKRGRGRPKKNTVVLKNGVVIFPKGAIDNVIENISVKH